MANTPSVTAQKGRLFVLQVSDGTSPTSYTSITGLRAVDITINSNPVDISNKASNGWRELLPDAGIKQVSISASGVYDSASTRLVALMQNALAPTLVEARLQSGAGDHLYGTWALSNFKRGATHDNVETFDLALDSHGPVIWTQN